MNSNFLKVKKAKLQGAVRLSGAKNCALKLLTASVLTNEDVEIFNSPNGLLDMQVHIKMLNKMGKTCVEKEGYLKITENSINTELLWDERSIRNSLLILGTLTTRFGKGKVPLPGGCPLGDRKYDLHVMILEQMGAKVWEEDGYLCTESKGRLRGGDIYLPMRSTGATENAILCATLADGKTTIWNPHIRPEIILAGRRMNDSMGAYVASEVIKLMIQKDIKVKDANILVLGITFKENCPDVRNTRAVDVINNLTEFGTNVTIFDPWANPEEVMHEYALTTINKLSSVRVLKQSEGVSRTHDKNVIASEARQSHEQNGQPTTKYDAIVLTVAHKEFLKLDLNSLLKENGVIYDVKGVLECEVQGKL